MPKKLHTGMSATLIAAVRKRDCLYDISRPSYRNRNTTELAWKDVANEVRRDVAFCKNTWASLRATFNRNIAFCLKHTSSGSADDRPHRVKWRHFEQMFFLKDHVSHGRLAQNLTLEGLDLDPKVITSTTSGMDTIPKYEIEIPSTSQEEEALDSLSSRSSSPEHEMSPTFLEEVSESLTSGSPPSRKRRKSPTPVDPLHQPALQEFKSSKQRQTNHDDDDMVCLRGLLPFFKDLPPIKKMKFVHRATGLLMDLHNE